MFFNQITGQPFMHMKCFSLNINSLRATSSIFHFISFSRYGNKWVNLIYVSCIFYLVTTFYTLRLTSSVVMAADDYF